MVSVTKHNTPALRFDGFDGEWEAQPLSKLGSSYGGLTGKTKEDFGYGDARYITYLDVFEHALINDASRLGATDIDNRQNEVKAGDVLFTVSSEVPDEVGMSAVWLGQGRDIYLNSFCFGFRPTVELDSKFLAYALRSPDFREKMTLLAQGISRFNISKLKAMELEIEHPALEEQRAIGELFADLDALIEQHRAKHANLQQTKTALLQRMFPQDGADEPELRLGGFSGAWEATEVKHIAARAIGGGTPSRTVGEYWNGSIPWIQSSDVKEHTVFGCTPKHFISSRGLASSATSLVKGGSIAVVTRVGVGKVAIMTEDYCSSQDFLNLSGLQGDLTFLGVLLQSKLEEVSSQTQGTSIKGVTKENVMSLSIQVPPTLEEQGAIGEVFSDLDALIAAEDRYITQLTQAKTALLQRMFV